ncbi:hypothetical protein CPB84DRAFT_1793984, partial [Gymnopilus junonius]
MDVPSLLPNPPQTQALSSKTFLPPPLNGSLTLPELCEWQSKNSPNHRLFVFSRENGQVRTICWPEAVRAIHNGTRLVRKFMGWQPGMKDAPVVAILAASDTITYFTMIMSIMRAGYVAFPISPRNSPAAVAHLINKVSVKHVFVGREQAMIDLGKEALAILKAQHPGIPELEFSPAPVFEELYVDNLNDFDDFPYEKRGPDDIVVYLHSSGSTAFPKPIAWTNHRFAQLALIPYFGQRDLTDVVFSLHTIPMYHSMGVFQLSWTLSCGLVLSTFEPRSPAHIPTPQNHFQAAVASHSDIILSVPSIIEAWSRNPDYVKWLATRGGVLFGGGTLNKEAGDHLSSKGVSVFTLYGSTEGGIISPFLPAEVDHDWEYFKFPGNVTPEMVPNGNGTYELVMLANPFCRPSIINTQINGVDSYATSDLLIEHPQKRGCWRVYGRADDQIMHNTGEKTNPGPLENMLNQDPHVQSSVMFGRGEFQAGIIVEPKADFKFDPSDENKLAEFRNKIWPTIQRMNAFAPQHSRLFKEMIIVCEPSKPFQYTAKSTARRQAIVNEYAGEIKALYDAVADSAQSNIPSPLEWDSVSILHFVRAVVDSVLNHGVGDNEDIFQRGCDSLQATWIRNSLLRALRESAEVDTRNLVDNFVYDNPTIFSMASFLGNVVAGISYESKIPIASRTAYMRSLVERYTTINFPVYKISASNESGSSDPQPGGHIVLLTGSTGALGSYLLADLVKNPEISRVYALNRSHMSGSSSLRNRHEIAFLKRGLESDTVLGSDKVRLLESDLTVPHFGLEHEILTEMKSSVTHVIHNAWPVDFNRSLTSFEPNIKGLRNLIDFALSSTCSMPPVLVYTSSIGVFQNVESIGKMPLPEAPITAEVAVGTGYAESKWVSEEILMHISNKSRLKSVIVRVGQLSGGVNGAWNTAEWLPALVQSGQICGCLPIDERLVDWIPLDMAAKSLADFSFSRNLSLSTIIHLIHPRPTPWKSLANCIASDLSIPLVPFSQWLETLEQHGKSKSGDHIEVDDMRRIPALRLLQFFKDMSVKIEDSPAAFGFPCLASEMGVGLSPTLSSMHIRQLDKTDVNRWLGYWRNVGFIKA